VGVGVGMGVCLGIYIYLSKGGGVPRGHDLGQYLAPPVLLVVGKAAHNEVVHQQLCVCVCVCVCACVWRAIRAHDETHSQQTTVECTNLGRVHWDRTQHRWAHACEQPYVECAVLRVRVWERGQHRLARMRVAGVCDVPRMPRSLYRVAMK
jgi:hypothetical protein